MTGPSFRTEEFKVNGEAVVSTIKQLLHEGNVRRITIKNEEGHTLLEVPLTLGVVGALLLPTWAAIGAVAALVAHLTIVLEKVDETEDAGGTEHPGAAPPEEPAAPATSGEPTSPIV